MVKNKNAQKDKINPTNCKNTKTASKTNDSESSKNTIDGEGKNRGLRDENMQSLLERRKLHLVLDLDNTLIHCTTLSNRCRLALKDTGENKLKKAADDDELHEILGGGFVIKLRPGARTFISEASSLFDLSIYTKSGKAYGVEVAKLLANSKDETCLFTEVTSSKHNGPKETKKELCNVMAHERVVVVVDDRVDVWRQCDLENLINIKPYSFFPDDVKCWPKLMRDTAGEVNDGELGRVMSLLKDVHSMFYDDNNASEDVRQVLKMVGDNSDVR